MVIYSDVLEFRISSIRSQPMASKKRRKTKASKKVGKKVRRKRAAPVAKSSHVAIGLLQKINKKVTRIDHTVNQGFHTARKTKKAKRKSDLEQAWAEREESGYE